MKKILMILLVGFLFSCATTVTKEDLLTGSWKYIPKEKEDMKGTIDFNADGTFYYHGYTQGAKLLQVGTWKFSGKTELELFVKKIIINDQDQRIVGKNIFVHVNTLTKGKMILEFGTKPKQVQHFEKN
jgi:hypothetical protein